MPRITYNQTNFTSGVLSPSVFGRTDVARYSNAAKALINVLVNVHGGAQRRPGGRFIAGTKTDARRSRLIPFVFSRTQAYVIELGHLYMRFYLQSGGQIMVGSAPYEIPSPYTEDEIWDVDFTQGADTMFLFHPLVPTQALKRFASDNWTVSAASWITQPYDEIGHQFPATQLSLSSKDVNLNQIFTSSVAVFMSSDVGRRIIGKTGGQADIIAVTAANEVHVNTTEAFPSTLLDVYQWTLADTPQAAITPSAANPVGAAITLTAPNTVTPTYGPILTLNGLNQTGTTVTATVTGGHGFGAGQAVVVENCFPPGYNGTYNVTVIDAQNFSYTAPAGLGSVSQLGTVKSVTNVVTTTPTWRASDVGKFVSINGGLVRIDAYISDIQVRGIIVKELSSAVSAQANAWVLMGSVWSSQLGYPSTGAFYEQRLTLAGSPSYPQTTWGSRTGQYFDFTQGSDDDDGFSFTLPATGEINPINRLTSASVLLPLTEGAEFTMYGGVEKPLTPTNAQIKPRSFYGAADAKPIKVGSEILFVQRANKRVRALAYDADAGAYSAQDLTVLAEHLMDSGIVELAYQQEPRSCVWAAMGDGTMNTMTLDRTEQVTAWTQQMTDGAYESVASIPNATGNEVWAIVRRTVNGVDRRYVERFDPGLHCDCAVTGAAGVAQSTWSGLSHLEGKTVWAKRDGYFCGSYAVSGGQITLDKPALAVEIGLPYESTIDLLTPEIATGEGSAQSNRMSTSGVFVRVLGTAGVWVDTGDIDQTYRDQFVSSRLFGNDILDRPAPDTELLAELGQLGWEQGKSPLTIKQKQPYDFHVLGVIRTFTVNS